MVVMSVPPIETYGTPQGGEIAYRRWGQGGPPLLVLHGLGDHSLIWGRVAPLLGDRYRVIAPDLRGHGYSSKPDDPRAYEFAPVIEDLRHLCQHLGWSRVTVVGHSWGAKVAARWADTFPQEIARLVLLDPFFLGAIPGGFALTFPLLYRVLPFLKTMGPFPDYPSAEKVARTLKQYQGWQTDQQRIFQESMVQDERGQWRSRLAIAARDGVFTASMTTPALTHPVAVPTVLILPRAGLNRFAWQTALAQRHLSPLQIQGVPGHHWALVTEAAAVAMAIAD